MSDKKYTVEYQTDSSTMVIQFPYSFSETYGSNTLLGIITENMQKEDGTWREFPTTVILVFPFPPRQYLEQQGPYLSLMPHYMPICLIEDILTLVKKNVTLLVKEQTQHPL